MTDTPGWTSPDQPDRPGSQPGAQPAGEPPAGEPPAPPGWSSSQPPPAWGQAPPPPGAGPSGPTWGPAGGPPGWSWAPEPEVKPGVVPLRPIGVGEILDGAISTMRAHVRPMLGLSALVVTVAQLAAFGMLALVMGDLSSGAATLDENASLDEVLDVLGDAVAVASVTFVLDWVAVLFLTGMLTVVVSKAVLGQKATVSDAWTALRPRLFRLVLLSLVTTALVLLAGLLPVTPVLLLAAAGAGTAVVVALSFPAVLAALALMVYVYVALALATPALVLEKQGVRASMARSRRLVRGSWWRVLGILLLAALLTGVISSIIATPFQILAGGGTSFFTSTGQDADLSVAALFVVTIGQILGATLTYPFSAAVTVLLYVDLRMRREGLDLELARAAGLRHPREDAARYQTPPTGYGAGWGAAPGWGHPGSTDRPGPPPPPRW